MTTIDLNSDLGEAFGAWTMGDDDAMLEIVTSANIACGFHAGDPSVALHTCRAAAERGVVVGAHVSYWDRSGFGRRFIDEPPDELHAQVLYQLGALAAMARIVGVQVRYVKPHGALYNAMGHHEGQAGAVIAAIRDYDPALMVVGLPGSLGLQLAQEAGLRTVTEAFADRGYLRDGTLAPRSQPGAVLSDADEVASRMVQLVTQGTVQALDGSTLRIEAQSICAHGDSPGAVCMARATRAQLEQRGVQIRAFA